MANSVIRKIEKHSDKRGWLAEVLREDMVGKFKQVYVFTMLPNIDEVRGGHYHKNRTEWFCCIKGKVKVTLHYIDEDDERDYILSGQADDLQSIEIPPMTWHEVKNVGSRTAIVISGISDLYDKEEPDTYKSID